MFKKKKICSGVHLNTETLRVVCQNADWSSHVTKSIVAPLGLCSVSP